MSIFERLNILRFVAPPIPLQGIYAAVTRSTVDGKHPNGWVPSQKMTLEEALEAYTINAAYAEGEEEKKGMVKVGYLADLVLLPQDITQLPPQQLWNLKVSKTIVAGNVVYEQK
jgi:predicted amidohydrolase YtcJ